MATARFAAISLSPFAFALSLASAGCAPSDLEAEGSVETTNGRITVGSVGSMLDRLAREKTATSHRYTFPTPRAAVRTVVEDFYDADGQISMVGRAADSADSDFIFKADQRGAYGWLVYKDRNLAWEYTTADDGKVVVEEVPVTKIFPVCPVPPDDVENSPPGPEADNGPDGELVFNTPGFPAHVGTYSTGDVLKLQSRPGATKVWFINFADTMNGSEPKSGHTKADVWQSWAITAAMLYPWEINVTTDPAVYAAAGRPNSGCVTMIFADIGAGSSCGLNIMGTGRCCNNHLYRGGYATGRIINHESGHGLGMGHDGGDNGGEYFNGFSEFQWTPLMGNVWPGDRWMEGLFQWSKGEYTSATQRQDDLAIISRALQSVPDDIPDSKPLTIEGTMVRREANWGQIGQNTDTDAWTFRVGAGGGRATLKINRIEDRGGGMLDVDASIVGSTGQMLAQNNTMVARHANLAVDLPAGDYTLVVKSGGEGTPARGFSPYSSVGLYAIEGTITGGMTGGGTGGTSGSGGASGAGGAAGAGGRAGTSGTAGMAGGGGAGAGGSTGAAGSSAGGTSGGRGGSAGGRGGASGGGGGGGSTGAAGGGGVGGMGGAAGNVGGAGSGAGAAGVGGSVGGSSGPVGGAGGTPDGTGGASSVAGRGGSSATAGTGGGTDAGGSGGRAGDPTGPDGSVGPGGSDIEGGCACAIDGRAGDLPLGVWVMLVLGGAVIARRRGR